MRIRLEFKLPDMWIGIFWKKNLGPDGYRWKLVDMNTPTCEEKYETMWDLWICLVPCLPIHISWSTTSKTP